MGFIVSDNILIESKRQNFKTKKVIWQIFP